MEVITLDDTADSSLFVFDDTPIMEEVTNRPNGRKRKLKGKNSARKPNIVLGGTIQDDSFTLKPKLRKNKRKKSDVETIVIDDEDEDDDGSVIELSDDEKVGVIGGLLCGSIERIQQKVSDFQKIRERNKRLKKKNKTPVLEAQKSSITPATSVAEPSKPRKLRPIVIDGSNVAFGHGGRSVFSSRGIEICYEYFKKKGHTVKVFIPQFRRRHQSTTDTHILDRLEEERVIVFTPSRRINGKTVSSYDDRMMVEYAAQCGAVIVTRDNLLDLVSESESFKEVINERLLMFTWVDENVILFPQDPLGRNGPKLDDFLAFPSGDDSSGKAQ